MKNIVGIDNLLDTMDTKELFDWLNEEAETRYTGTIAGYICDLRNKFATLTEQLRLANEDAERLANVVKGAEWSFVGEDADDYCPYCKAVRNKDNNHSSNCGLEYALYQHEQLRNKKG